MKENYRYGSDKKIKYSSRPEDLKKCLKAGVVPEIYKGILKAEGIKERSHYEYETTACIGGELSSNVLGLCEAERLSAQNQIREYSEKIIAFMN